MKVVAVSGGFDPIHIGHIRNILEAGKLGTRLIVILTRDDQLIAKKGHVFMPYEERAEILRAITGVDDVVSNIDETIKVYESLRLYRPDVFAKGGDRTPKTMIPEEVEVCNSIGCEVVYGVGGGKIQSSSLLAPKVETSIIIPARNEEKGLETTLDALYKLVDGSYEVIVVDGASANGTIKVARRFPCRIVRQPVNQLGKGRGLIMGINQAKGEKVIWIDADDTYPVEMVPRMADDLDKYDIVTCSRKWGKDNMPKFNRFGNWLFKVLIQRLHGFKGNDPCTGLYGVRREHLLRMNLTSTHFAIEPEISIKAGHMKLKTLDIPVTYTPRVGDTKLNPIKVGFEDMWTIFKLIGWRSK